jgi:hypothetical protein
MIVAAASRGTAEQDPAYRPTLADLISPMIMGRAEGAAEESPI